MSEEEKKAIEYWKRDIALYHWNTQLASEHYSQIILNLIENQQEELNNLKEIEKSHKEENGKLRVELEQEKEKNKTKIDIKDIEFSNFIKERYVSKDKIKEKLELLKDILKAKEKDENIYKQIPIEYLKGAIEQLEELLEEK